MELSKQESKEKLKAYQNDLRDKVKLRCQKQTAIAAKCKMSKIWFNNWIKGHKELGPVGIKNVILFLEQD